MVSFCSRTAARIWPSATLLQEHTWAPWSSPAGASDAPADTSEAGGTVQRLAALEKPEQRAEFRGVADQDAAQQASRPLD